MNPTANQDYSPTKQRISQSRRCVAAIDEIEPCVDAWEDDEVARMIQFNGMIGTDNLIYGND